MVKQFVAVTSLVAGLAAVGLAVFIEMDPSVLTTPSEGGTARTVDTPVVPAARAVEIGPKGETIFAPSKITVDPADVVVPKPRLHKPLKPKLEPVPEVPLATEPCSEWRELGPKATDTLEGAHRVRQLCVS